MNPPLLNITKTIESTILKYSLLEKVNKVLIAISGGPDSVFLAYIMREMGYDIGLAHVNYQLRGEESDADETLVREYAEVWKVPLFVKKIDTPALLKETSEPMQVVARDIRYGFFESIFQKHSYDACAIAHHADDQVENLLMSLLHGNSSHIWKGMPIKRGKYIRPMIEVARADIMKAIEETGLTWRLDASNLKTDYLRNRYRHKIVPELEQIQTDAQSKLLQKNAWYKLQHQFIAQQLENILPTCLSSTSNGKYLDWQPFKETMGEEHLSLLIVHVLEKWGIHGHLLWECVRLQDSMSGKWVNTPKGRVVRSRNGIVLIKESFEDGLSITLETFEGEKEVVLQSRKLLFRFPENQKPDFTRKDCFYLDSEKINWPLKIRTWRQGDRMQPFGMKQRKKLSDIFVDEKFSLLQKQQAIIIEDQEEIVCLSDFRIADRVKIDKGSNRVLSIYISDL